MPTLIDLEGKRYDVSDLTDHHKETVRLLSEVNLRIQELENLRAIFNRARNSYLADLKSEIVTRKSGVDLNALFSD